MQCLYVIGIRGKGKALCVEGIGLKNPIYVALLIDLNVYSSIISFKSFFSFVLYTELKILLLTILYFLA